MFALTPVSVYIATCGCATEMCETNSKLAASSLDISGQYSVKIDESFIYKVKVRSVNKYILCTYLQRKQVYFTAIR